MFYRTVEKFGISFAGHFTVVVMLFFFPIHLQILCQEDNIKPKQNTPGNKSKVSRERARFQKQKEDVQAIGKSKFTHMTSRTSFCRFESRP